ncbi:Alpha/Beta hydrolase protein [Ilyonectria sp. MPI-CAGE-AT-0026]|nr:Alpha/Beta hydrolase protein [Ilyonectria sp. MPI-CAGE-AT-0026]
MVPTAPTLLALLQVAAAAIVPMASSEPYQGSSYRVQPVAQSFNSDHGLPAFSLRLGNDTGSVCNSSTPGISGYIDTEDSDESHLFFWFFESKHDPTSDPLILWIGPGASSAGYGNLMELGPCRIAPEGGYTVENPFGWNKNASVLFVDQPVSVGFSAGKRLPHGLVEASQMMDRFLRQFITAFPQMADRDLYIAGESYGGSWVPALASTILQTQGKTGNDAAQRPSSSHTGLLAQRGVQGFESTPQSHWDSGLSNSLPVLKLKGILIGNGLVRLKVQNPGAFETACSGPDGLLNAEQCLEWAPWAMWCELNMGVCETAGPLSPECKATHQKCTALDDFVLGKLKRNPYNWQQHCDADDMLGCFPELALIDQLLNRSDVKKALGVEESTPFTGFSMDVWDEWQRTGDVARSSHHYVNYLLESGIRVLIYVGDKDFLATAAGTRLLVNEGLVWHGRPLFRFRELVPWYHGTKVAGRWKAYGELTYAEIFGSGHLTPFDLPAETLSLVNGWIFGGNPPAQ